MTDDVTHKGLTEVTETDMTDDVTHKGLTEVAETGATVDVRLGSDSEEREVVAGEGVTQVLVAEVNLAAVVAVLPLVDVSLANTVTGGSVVNNTILNIMLLYIKTASANRIVERVRDKDSDL